MEYCIIASNYPSKNRHVHVFLENLVAKFVDSGIKCNVIAPQSSKNYFFNKKIRRDLVAEYKTDRGNKYTVYSPIYTVYPSITICGVHFADASKKSFYKAVKKVYKKNNLKADIIYSHFLHAGTAAVKLGEYLNVPSYIACGEANTVDSVKKLSKKLIAQTLNGVTGIVAVSTKNKEEIYTLCNGNEDIMKKVMIAPNAPESTRFYNKDKNECRQKLGFPKEKLIVAFTGSFIERKGVLRLSHVLDRFEDVYSIFIGTGKDIPKCKNILHCGRVPNTEMCDYLNAADIFVLPTLAEGCCNAIVEAVVCGIPIISSDRSFNYDVLDQSCSILIDPMDEEAIYRAIKLLKEDVQLRQKLHEGALKKAENLSLDKRMANIVKFIENTRK